MNRGALLRYGAVALVAAAIGGLVVHVVDDDGSSAKTAPATASGSPGLPYLRAGCQIVLDTLQRADQEAEAKNASVDLSKLAHPYHRQDVWNTSHEADLQRALNQLDEADHYDSQWHLVAATVRGADIASVATTAGTLGGIDLAHALADAGIACAGR